MVQQMTLNDAIEEREKVAEAEIMKVTPWEGERIHDMGMDDLELTLGSGTGRTWKFRLGTIKFEVSDLLNSYFSLQSIMCWLVPNVNLLEEVWCSLLDLKFLAMN